MIWSLLSSMNWWNDSVWARARSAASWEYSPEITLSLDAVSMTCS